MEAVEAARKSDARFVEALMTLELVASQPVHEAASQVHAAAEDAAEAFGDIVTMDGLKIRGGAWKVSDEKAARLEETRRALQAAIRAELQLDG